VCHGYADPNVNYFTLVARAKCDAPDPSSASPRNCCEIKCEPVHRRADKHGLVFTRRADGSTQSSLSSDNGSVDLS
jgi:hypothetical protein